MNPNILNGFNFLEAKDSATKLKKSEKGALTIVCADKKKCGNRILLSKQLESDLNLSGSIQICVSEDGESMLIASLLDKEQPLYNLKRLKKGDSSSRYVLYSAGVVHELIEKMNLDFSETVSFTFYDVKYHELNGLMVAQISKGGE